MILAWLPSWLRQVPGRQLIRLCRAHDDTEALTLAIPHLPASLFDDALDAIRELPTSEGAPLLAALAGRLPEDRRAAVWGEAWRGVPEADLVHRLAMLADLAGQGYRQPQLAAQALKLYLGMDVMLRARFADTPRRLQRAVVAFPTEILSVWNGALRRFAQESQCKLVYQLVDLVPITLALMPSERRSKTVQEILRALDDIERWWP